MNVYWSPWYPKPLYADLHLLYETPPSLFDELRSQRVKERHNENWLSCYAVLEHLRNTFILRFPSDISFGLHSEFGIIQTENDSRNVPFVGYKQPSLSNAYTFSILNNWIFWSDEPLLLSSFPAFYHRTSFDGYYVGGTFDISKWFRPLEAAIQLHPQVDMVEIKTNDPLAYIKFATKEQVTLKRFYLSDTLSEIAQGCIDYKKTYPRTPLFRLYNKFLNRGLNKIICKEIMNNQMD